MKQSQLKLGIAMLILKGPRMLLAINRGTAVSVIATLFPGMS